MNTDMVTKPIEVGRMIAEAMRRGWSLRSETPDGGCLDRRETRVILSIARELDGKFWLHLSVSKRDRKLPEWQEMVNVKREFIGDETTALMVIPPKSKHVNIHPGVHHIWQCLEGEVTPDFTRGSGSL